MSNLELSELYIVIVTYNAANWVDYSVAKLRNITSPYKIIIVDNNSLDNTCSLITQNFPEVELMALSQNIGFGCANNVGIRVAYEKGAKYIVLLNQDAWIEPYTIDFLINAHQNAKSYGILSPMHMDGSGISLDYNFKYYISRNIKLISDLYLKGKEELDEIYKVEFVNAAIWLIPRDTVTTVGGFNPLFFMYGEDVDYINRCRYHNLKIGVVPRARAYHGRPQVDSTEKQAKLDRITRLVGLVDPNKKLTVWWVVRYLLINSLTASLLLDFKRAKKLFSDAFYFVKNHKQIAQSKKNSMQQKFLYLGA